MKYMIRNDVSYILTNKGLLFILYFVAISFVSMLYIMGEWILIMFYLLF